VSHAPSWRRRLPSDEADDRLLHLPLHEVRGFLLIGPTDLADHHHRGRLAIPFERIEAVDEVRAVDRIATNTDARCLADARARHLKDDLVGQRAGSADQPDRSRSADASRDDPDLRLAG
jgi:hypothetical protein